MNLGFRNKRSDDRKGPDDRCPTKACRTLLEFRTLLTGEVIGICKPCERNKKGLCRDCPAKLNDKRIPGKAGGMRPFRCRRCRLRFVAQRRSNDYHARPEHYRKIKNRSARRPKVRARQLRYVKAWKERQPKRANDDLDRLYFKLQARKNRKARRLKALMAGKVKRITPRDFRLIVEAA